MKLQFRVELEFEQLESEMREVMDVELIRLMEMRVCQPYIEGKDEEYTTAHMKAGRKILQALRNKVQKRGVHKAEKKG